VPPLVVEQFDLAYDKQDQLYVRLPLVTMGNREGEWCAMNTLARIVDAWRSQPRPPEEVTKVM
jgi:hypothetical protein